MTHKQFFNLILVITALFLTQIGSEAKSSVTVGKGIWINIWNYPENPEMYCEQLKSKGIDTIYLQISRSNTPAIKNPASLNKIIKSAHSRNIKVIGWIYSFLKDPISDAQKFLQAVFYRTPGGDSLDGIAADIEEVTNSRSIETFAKAIRKSVGPKYPLIAITFSPVLKRADPRHYAWKTIANNFDIIAPMTYWHGFVKLRSEKGAYDYTAQTISKIKEYTQKDNLQIHLIGDGQKTSSAEINGFLRAAGDHNINAGVSLYPWYTPKEHQVEALGMFKLSND
ncbi:MAG: hypothetical protein A3F80_02700 [Candidatus Melainabacteria bacterium RIFCSPLOWO2_12_FULL_35_11]|nr:MAG: hypothetical protein A3F80_02700 [Candidatus Melainabacteria bacterium RIFCSPLOWO2_12_FULL_35_11]